MTCRKIISAAIFLFLCQVAQAQTRCGTLEYNHRKQVAPSEKEDFEEWIKNIHDRIKHSKQKTSEYTVHLVIHIIHKGESIGDGTNLSEEQILSQLQVLNEDFNRLNPDANNTLPEFQSLAGRMEIQFKLATLDPNGNATNGINRVKVSDRIWTYEDDTELKALSYWPAEKYLNIWICDLIDYRAYTQFPLSTLEGLESASLNRLTDGIVINYLSIGSNDHGNFDLTTDFDKGRTLTHEVGHFFGLRHIWGDKDDCTGTDYVRDTPPQAGASQGCPIEPEKSCPENAPVSPMYQNFMDYTNDGCMNLFTQGQIDRMKIVLENSPRRASLLQPSSQATTDHEAEKIFSPNGDGTNDYWRWTNTLQYEGCTLKIFNRFGRQVYEQTSYQNSWNGRSSDGYILEAGVYYYTVDCHGQEQIKGAVTIVK
jgi:gliding motility-associated-like protein